MKNEYNISDCLFTVDVSDNFEVNRARKKYRDKKLRRSRSLSRSIKFPQNDSNESSDEVNRARKKHRSWTRSRKSGSRSLKRSGSRSRSRSSSKKRRGNRRLLFAFFSHKEKNLIIYIFNM
ncbi:hypothetical protein TCON_1731 [Astathelohania contejeani]|uniref:Uncharacterized protein n=1 Tax=Astathelohania contejeani TaxID=164912 RepID=A0ABQ7HY44_9MICR|nr:hypothetical protein TCON_1731 [Thelohania contejeani]